MKSSTGVRIGFPVVHDPGRPRGGARDGDVLVVEALRVAAVRQVDRNDRELEPAREAGQVDQRDDRERLLGARDVAVEEEDHVVAGGNVRRGLRRELAERVRGPRRSGSSVRRSGTGSARSAPEWLPLAGTVTGSSYCSRRRPRHVDRPVRHVVLARDARSSRGRHGWRCARPPARGSPRRS